MRIRVHQVEDFLRVGCKLAFYLCLAVGLHACGGSSGGGGSAGSGGATGSNGPAPGTFQITAISAGNGSAQISWTDALNAASYSLFYGRTSGSYPNSANTHASSGSTINDLNNGFEYYFAVSALNTKGSSQATFNTPVRPMYVPRFTYTCVRNFYVSTTGNDGNLGTTENQAYATINEAAARADLTGGDCINVLPGTYIEEVWLSKSGSNSSPTGHIVLRSTIPLAAKVIGAENGYSAINFDANYLVVDGFDVTTPSDGSAIDGCRSEGKHHLVAINNYAHDAGLGGIGMCWGDYFYIEGNITARNSALSGYQGSGISIYEARAVADSAPGFHNVVRNNVTYANFIRFDCNQCHTDGNGIIMDDFRNTQTSGPWKDILYPYETLVENNLSFANGGKGVHVFLSNHITLRNNTAYYNNQDTNFNGTWRAELSNTLSGDNTWINNIGVTDPGININNAAILDGDVAAYNLNVVWKNNLAYSAGGSLINLVHIDNSPTTVSASQGNLIGANPQFLAASLDPMVADLRLGAGSPAIGSGLVSTNPDTLNGRPRPVSGPVDMGAY